MSGKTVTLRNRKGDTSSLLGDVIERSRLPSLRHIPLTQIRENTFNPRRNFDAAAIDQLAASIRADGLLEPLVVREVDGTFEIIAGMRRYRALVQSGAEHADCKVLSDISDEQAKLLALVENLNRENLSPLDELDAVLAIVQHELNLATSEATADFIKAARNYERSGTLAGDLTSENVEQLQTLFKRIGISSISSFVANRLPLLNMPDDVLTATREGRITLTHARVLVKLSDETERRNLIEQVHNQGMTSRELEAQVALKAEKSTPTLDEQRISSIRRRLTPKRFAGLPVSKRKKLARLLEELESLLE